MESKETGFDKVEGYLGRVKGSRYDKSARIYRIIIQSDDPQSVFRYFLENGDYISSSEEEEAEEYFTAQQLNKYEQEYAELVDALLTRYTKHHYEKEKFYEELWKSVMDSDMLFSEERAKIYALGKVWSDSRIPYFHLDPGLKMSNEEFVNIIDKNKELLQEATFVLGAKYEQKTETSSLLLKILDKCEDFKDQAIIMARIIDLVEKQCMVSLLNRN